MHMYIPYHAALDCVTGVCPAMLCCRARVPTAMLRMKLKDGELSLKDLSSAKESLLRLMLAIIDGGADASLPMHPVARATQEDLTHQQEQRKKREEASQTDTSLTLYALDNPLRESVQRRSAHQMRDNNDGLIQVRKSVRSYTL